MSEEEKETERFHIGAKQTSIPNKWIIQGMLVLAIGSPWIKAVVIPERPHDAVSSNEVKAAVVKSDYDNAHIIREIDELNARLDRLDRRMDKITELMAVRAHP